MSLDRALCAGRYRLERTLGRGPSGVVYVAVDQQTGAGCALKRLHAQFHDEAALLAVQKDALAAAMLSHPAIIAPHAMGFDEEGSFYLVQERGAGESLRARLQRGPLPLQEAVLLLAPLCAALEAAHRAGVHHGDLHPGNVLCGDGAGRLTDFGMWRLGQAPGAGWVGPAGYLPPESYRGEVTEATARGDVFALGALLYECLTGQRLFEGASPSAVMFKVCMAPLPSLSSVLPHDKGRVEAVLAMACDKDPEARFDHAGALLRALQAVAGETTSAAPPAPIFQPAAVPHPVVLEPIVTGPAPAPPPAAPPPAVAPPPSTTVRAARAAPATAPELDSWLQDDAGSAQARPGDAAPDPALLDEAGPPPRPRVRRLALWAAGGGLAMGGALLLVSWLGTAPKPTAPAPDQQLAAAGPPGPDRPPAVARPQEDPPAAEVSLDAGILTAEDKLASKDYAGALSIAEDLLRGHPQDPAVRAVHRRARDAVRLQMVYQDFLRAAERADTDSAVALYRELPAGSAFRADAQAPFAKVRERFEESHIEIANAAMRSGACEEVRRQADLLLSVAERPEERAAAEARRLAARCRAPAIAETGPLAAATRPQRPPRRAPAGAAGSRTRPSPHAASEQLKNPFERW